MIALVGAYLQYPYFVAANHPTPASFEGLVPWPAHRSGVRRVLQEKTVALNAKRGELESLLADYAFQKKQEAITSSQSGGNSLVIVGGFAVGAILLALGLKKFLQRA